MLIGVIHSWEFPSSSAGTLGIADVLAQSFAPSAAGCLLSAAAAAVWL